MSHVAALILGGGHGTRLLPLTLERSKPAVGFGGRYRLIDIPISNCINSGIKRLFVLTQFLSVSLHRHIMQTYRFDSFSDGFIDILAAEQTATGSEWFLGTADAVRATLGHTMYFPSEQVLILPGDHLYRMDYGDLLRFHRRTHAEVTVAVHVVPRADASELGLIRMAGSGHVLEIVEKPSDPATIARFAAPPELLEQHNGAVGEDCCLASMGIYVFQPRVLNDLLTHAPGADLSKSILPEAVARHRVMAFPFADYWKDIGTVPAFYEANISLTGDHPPFNLHDPQWPIHSRSRSLPPSRVRRSRIEECILGQGCDLVGTRIERSVIGVRSVVREETTLDGVVVLGADFYEGEPVLGALRHRPHDPLGRVPTLGIGRHCRIERAIIDKNVRIGNDVVIRARPEGTPDSEAPTHWVRSGITVIPKATVIPDGTVI